MFEWSRTSAGEYGKAKLRMLEVVSASAGNRSTISVPHTAHHFGDIPTY
jgi:hypothetical protein